MMEVTKNDDDDDGYGDDEVPILMPFNERTKRQEQQTATNF